MKLRSRKFAFYMSAALVLGCAPLAPIVADTQSTYEQQRSTITDTGLKSASELKNSEGAVYEGFKTDENIFSGKAIAIASPYLEVFEGKDTETTVCGRLYEDTIVDVVAVEKEWTKINSGNVSGYVKTSSLCIGEEARLIASEIEGYEVKGNIKSLTSVYKPGNAAEAVITANVDDKFVVKEQLGDYYVVVLEDGTQGYVVKNDVALNYGLQVGMTMEEVEAKEAEEAAKAEEEARQAAQEAAMSRNPSASNMGATPASYDDAYLLAMIIDWEACGEPYEGKVAVADVVLNRLHSGRYGGSIESVIYAPGQFSGVSNGNYGPSATFSARLANGPRNGECMQAALDALAGVNYVGGYTGFRTVSSANLGSYSSYMIIGNHVFH